MIRRMEARISSIVGSCCAVGVGIVSKTLSRYSRATPLEAQN
jgi:hypothetical protein